MKVILLGTAWPFRGGLASFNERLIRELTKQGHDASIINFTTQYPGFLFPGKTQFSDSPAPANISITRRFSSVNPFTWLRTGRQLKKEAPDLLIIKYWMPFMAPCFGTIARIAKKNKHTKVICIADNIIPHERKFYDTAFSKFFIRSMDAFIAMSDSVLKELLPFDSVKLRATNPHPLFDNFGTAITKEDACEHLQLDVSKKYLLFFGFIRDYKGLDILLKAFAEITLPEVELIIAGEYYTDSKPYDALIQELHLENKVHRHHHFIADEEVKYYFCAADMVVQPYKHATQSGVTQIAYHFNLPMLVTNVGGLPEMVPHNKVGYVVEPNPPAIAASILDFYTNARSAAFRNNILEEKKRFSWERMVFTITELYQRIS